jgi:PAS domain S-box-containing protein
VVGIAPSATAAVVQAGELRPELALMDIRLKGNWDGIEAAGDILRLFDIPSIFLTAYADDETLERARAMEPLGYLVKPFEDRELRASIEMALSKHRTDQTLRLSELRFRTLVELAPDAIVMTDRDDRVMLCNEAAEALFGLRGDQLTGLELAAFLDRDGDGRWKAILEELHRTGAVRNIELPMPSPKGAAFWLELSASLMRDRLGDKTGIVAVCRDVTGRKLAESELNRLSAAVKLAGEGIIITDAAGNITFANASAAAMFEQDGSRLTGAAFADLLVPADRGKARMMLAESVRKGSIADVELGIGRRGGEAASVEVSASAMSDASGRPTGIVMISRDVGERRRAQQELRARLMTYELQDGTLYLVKERAPALSLEAFRDLLRAGYRGLVLSRTPPSKLSLEAGHPVEHRWISENGDAGSQSQRLDGLERCLEGLPRGRALLIDRLDYLISKNGLRPTLRFIHRLGEIAYLMGHVVIVSVDPTTIGERDLRPFEKEMSEVLPRARPELTANERELLHFIHQQSLLGVRPALTAIGAGLKLSKPTTRKKVRDLVRGGYLALSPRGRTKVLELTEKGRRMLD